MRTISIIALLFVFGSLHMYAAQSNMFQSWSDQDWTNRYSFSVSDADIAPTPVWLADASQPPLAPGDALRLAKDYLATLVSDSKVWTVDSIELDHWADGKHWLYIVLFKSPHVIDGQTGFDLQHQIHIPVLMSGVVINVKITPHPPLKNYSSKPGSTNIEVLAAGWGHSGSSVTTDTVEGQKIVRDVSTNGGIVLTRTAIASGPNPVSDYDSVHDGEKAQATFSGGDGLSIKDAVVITATNEETGDRAGYIWLHRHYPGSRLQDEGFDYDDTDRYYNEEKIVTADGKSRTVFFETTSYFGK